MTEPYGKNVAMSAADAAKIRPRAEFRVFGQNIIRGVQERMWDAGATLQKARRMPPEIYFLSRHTDAANVKVRDRLLDIKCRTGQTPEGYEIFQPAGKFEFPVSKADLSTILGHLKAPMLLDAATYTVEDFIRLARAGTDLVPVSVEKMRYGFTVGGVICEYAQVWLNGALIETACCESEDYAAMKRAVDALGLAVMENTSYIRAAKRVTGMI